MSVADDVRNTRDRNNARGDELNRQQYQRGELDRGTANRYRDIGEEYYTPMLEGRGGYSPDREAEIVGRDRLNAIRDGGDYSQYNYSPEEEAAMYGDPDSRYRYMQGWEGQIERQNNSSQAQRDAVSRMRDGLDSSITGDLALDGNYYRDTDAALSSSDAAANSAINKDELSMSKEFVDKYRMSPDQKRRIETAGALRTRASASAGVASAEAAARASGTGALGMAALKAQARRSADVDAADSMVMGRMTADDASANREKTIEDTRLGAAGRYAQLASSTAMAQGDRRVNMMQGREGLRLSSARDIADRKSGNAKTVGGAEVDVERDDAGRAARTDEFYTTTGTAIAKDVDRDYRTTAQTIADRRGQTARDVNADQFNRAAYADTNTTSRLGTTSDAQREDAREARLWMTGQQSLANQNSQNDFGRQAQTYGTQSGAANTADGNAVQADRAPRLWERIAGVGIGAVGALTGAGAFGGKK